MDKIKIFLLELGNLEVFTVQDSFDYFAKVPHDAKEVFWCRKDVGYVYGPFATIYEACQHYTLTQKRNAEIKTEGKIVYVDFGRKRKVPVEMPTEIDNITEEPKND